MLEFTQKHENLAPLIKSNPLFHTFAKYFCHLFLERHSRLIQYCSDSLCTIEELISFKIIPILLVFAYIYHSISSMPFFPKITLIVTLVRSPP